MLTGHSPRMVILAGGTEAGTTASGSGTNEYKTYEVDDPQVVGLDSDKRHILKHLLDKSIPRLTILSIVGASGLGKTTLAKKVYNSAEVDTRFDRRAWLSISQKFHKKKILRKILYLIRPSMKKKDPPVGDEDLLKEVRSYLSNKRYLIILDDVWTKDLWEYLEKALPDSEKGSRVIITTRNVDVARSADCNTKEHQLRFLTDDESVALLFRTALQRDIEPEEYPPPLKRVAQRLIKKCGGLPLALVMLGGILRTEERSFPAWDRVCDTMDWHDEDMDKCMKTLARSYEALRNDHLKRCFLYFASFPEDYEISAQHMIRMWVADELIPNPSAGTLEHQAEKYLQELVKRCLVQVTERSANGYCKCCRMNDLVRELAIHKAEEENFFTVFPKKGDRNNQQLPPERVAVHSKTSAYYGINSTNTRSLLCFHRNNSTSKYLQGFKQLRVLVFENLQLPRETSSLQYWLEGLVHLRYLGLRSCSRLSDKFFNNIFLLKSLETLDCYGTLVALNPSIWAILTLRHVITGYNRSVGCPLDWDHLENLQTLKWCCLVDESMVQRNINLRTVKILCREGDVSIKEERQRLQELLSRAEHLVSLAIRVRDKGRYVPFCGTHGLPCHEKIQSLRLDGRWTCVPSVEKFPINLTKLKLKYSGLKEDPMPILEKLQSLRILDLYEVSRSVEKMTCLPMGFPSLHKLSLRQMPPLRKLEIKKGAMPVLSHLLIEDCVSLDTLPRLQHVTSLQKLQLTGVTDRLFRRSQREDQDKILHIPSVRFTDVRPPTMISTGTHITEIID